MGIMTTQNLDRNSELGRRISADLKDRLQTPSRGSYDGDDDYDDNRTQKTGRFSWFWIILIVLALISLVCIVLL